SGGLSRIAGVPSSARLRGTLSAPTSGCFDERRCEHLDHGVNIQHLARLRILVNDCNRPISPLPAIGHRDLLARPADRARHEPSAPSPSRSYGPDMVLVRLV